MTPVTPVKERETSLDFLRGVAVLMMILAHAVFFFHNDSSPFLQALARAGNVVCFTLFLFVSGASGYYVFIRRYGALTARRIGRTIWRSGMILLGFYLLALVATVGSWNELHPSEIGGELLQILSLRQMPSFTEFLVPFVFFGLSWLFLRKLYYLSSRSLLVTVELSVLFYLLGYLGYPLEVNAQWLPYKALFFGDESLLRFPIFTYMPVFLWGLHWGHRLHTHTDSQARDRIGFGLGAVFAGFAVIAPAFNQWLPNPLFDPINRWPPSLSFLSIGLALAFLVSVIYTNIRHWRPIDPLLQVTEMLGRQAFDLYLVHILLLLFYDQWLGVQFAEPLIVLWLFGLLLMLSGALITLNWKNPPKWYGVSQLHFKDDPNYRFKKRHLVMTSVFIGLVFTQLNLSGSASSIGEVVSSRELTGAEIEVEDPLPALPEIQVELNRQWLLRSAPDRIELEPLILSATPAEALAEDVTLFFDLKDTEHSGKLLRQTDTAYQVEISPSTLPVGTHTLTVYAKRGEESLDLLNTEIHVSDPILVAWSVDWEGWDVPDAQLQSLSEQTQRHQDIPLTHFFNPRIFLPGVMSTDRANQLTRWVLSRREAYGEEIQLHMHMHFDMIEAAGLEKRENPRWGFRSEEGYDVFSTAYSQAEFAQLLDWAELQFVRNGLPEPTGYRAGGWFADEKMLQALAQRGFAYDASGREHLLWNGAARSPWNLNATTQPYHPSAADQNLPGGADALSLLEIPNNGGDAYAYSAEEMIGRFALNLPEPTSEHTRSVVFLSHPQWQERDEAIMEQVLNHTDERLYERDLGPVVYVTLSDIYQAFAS